MAGSGPSFAGFRRTRSWAPRSVDCCSRRHYTGGYIAVPLLDPPCFPYLTRLCCRRGRILAVPTAHNFSPSIPLDSCCSRLRISSALVCDGGSPVTRHAKWPATTRSAQGLEVADTSFRATDRLVPLSAVCSLDRTHARRSVDPGWSSGPAFPTVRTSAHLQLSVERWKCTGTDLPCVYAQAALYGEYMPRRECDRRLGWR